MVRVDLTPYAESLRRDLTAAADAGSEDVRAAAERLVLALDPAIRLTLLDALSEASDEITLGLAGSSVEVRLKGREPVFVVSGAAVEHRDAQRGRPQIAGVGAAGSDASALLDSGDADAEDTLARITLRLPESLKAKAEELAAQRGQSLNTWLVNAARNAAHHTNDPAWPLIGPGAPGANRSSNKRIRGWVR